MEMHDGVGSDVPDDGDGGDGGVDDDDTDAAMRCSSGTLKGV